MRKIEVMGSGYARPQHRIDNQDLETILDTSDEWIVQRTGVRERRIAKNTHTWELALGAAQDALAGAGGAGQCRRGHGSDRAAHRSDAQR